MMNRLIAYLLTGFFVFVIPAYGAGDVFLDGKYKGEAFSFLFEDGKCYVFDGAGKKQGYTEYTVKGDKVYIAPVVPRGQKMTRNVWVVYTISGGKLEFSHVEDMDSGQVFYKNGAPKITLVKE